MPSSTVCNSKMNETRGWIAKLVQSWYGPRRFFHYLLLPCAWLYQAIVIIRRKFYQWGWLPKTMVARPVIVVGNITTGGSGKTPLIIWLAHWLQQQGYRPGIVSRGYGGKASYYPYHVENESDPRLVGDEALLLRRTTGCPLVIAPKRAAAAQQLLATTDCSIVLSDDGLQHYALGRSIEIAVIDGERRLGNGLSLPAGPLRELPQRLNSVDLIVVNGGKTAPGEYKMELQAEVAQSLINPQLQRPLSSFKQQVVHAVAGIGNPERFFKMLRALGLNIQPHAFPDHHLFTPADLAFADSALILMTAKDAVKCQSFADDRYWLVPVAVQLDPAFGTRLIRLLKG